MEQLGKEMHEEYEEVEEMVVIAEKGEDEKNEMEWEEEGSKNLRRKE